MVKMDERTKARQGVAPFALLLASFASASFQKI
jgi:hypothetical protein